MFQIAMIEDEEHTRQEVERLISREFEKLKVQDITTEIYKTAEEFLEVKKRYDVVISDIDLPGKSGIDLGRILKAEQKDICLVFLTSYAEFAVDSYVLEAYQYILKRGEPLTESWLLFVELICWLTRTVAFFLAA